MSFCMYFVQSSYLAYPRDVKDAVSYAKKVELAKIFATSTP